MTTTSSVNVPSLLWAFVIFFFSYQMLQITIPYTSWEWDVDFLMTKQDIMHLDYYRTAFYSHIFTSLIVLLSGVFLFSNFILQKYPKLHRYAGRAYVFLLLLIAAPSGLVMAFHANGDGWTQLSFLILTPLWWWFTWKGFRTALQKDFKAHRIWMLRSYALTFSAISLRIYQMILGTFFFMEPEIQYLIVSWLSWMGNLVVIEFWIWYPDTRIKINELKNNYKIDFGK